MTLHEHDHITTSQHSARTFAPLSLFIAVERMHPNDFCCDVVFVDAAAAAVLLPFFASLFTLQIVITNYKPSFTTYFLTTRFFFFLLSFFDVASCCCWCYGCCCCCTVAVSWAKITWFASIQYRMQLSMWETCCLINQFIPFEMQLKYATITHSIDRSISYFIYFYLFICPKGSSFSRIFFKQG